MPLIQVHTSVPLSEPRERELLGELSRLIAETIGKPEEYVMAALKPAAITMAGVYGPAAFVDVRSIGGLSKDVNQRISQRVCALLKNSLGIDSERVYLTFFDLSAQDWGWNGRTFATSTSG